MKFNQIFKKHSKDCPQCTEAEDCELQSFESHGIEFYHECAYRTCPIMFWIKVMNKQPKERKPSNGDFFKPRRR